MHYPIAIAGCGVAGLTAALLLARQGHDVTLFEQSEQVGPAGAGVLLQPSGQLVLEKIGILQRVIARAERIDRLHALTHRGRSLIDLKYASVSEGLCAYGLHRGDLFSVLHAEVLSAGVRLLLNRRIARFAEDSNAVQIFDSQDRSCGSFDLFLAADGSRSLLRSASGLGAWVYPYSHGALWALGTCSAIKNKLYQVTQGTKLLCGLLPTGENRCSLFWSLPQEQKAALFDKGLDAWRRSVVQLVPEAEDLLAGLRSLDDTRYATYQHVHMNRWHTDRFALLGDAAHSMSPHLGQGINLALLDGFTIAHALAVGASSAAAFGLYQRLRRAHTRYYGFVTFMLSPFFQSRGFVKGWGRDIFLPLLPHTPILRGQMLLTMTGLKRSFVGGTLALPAAG